MAQTIVQNITIFILICTLKRNCISYINGQYAVQNSHEIPNEVIIFTLEVKSEY